MSFTSIKTITKEPLLLQSYRNKRDGKFFFSFFNLVFFLVSLEKDMAEREVSRSPGADRLRTKRNSLKPGRTGTSGKTKPRALSMNKNS